MSYNMVGRPIGSSIIYKESRKGILIQLPISILNELTDLSYKQKISRTEIINKFIKKGMEEIKCQQVDQESI